MNVPQYDISQIHRLLGEIKDELKSLNGRVNTQNGRVTKSEKRLDDIEALWDQHEHWSNTEKQEVLDAVGKMPGLIESMFQSHQDVILKELKFLRSRQDQLLDDVQPWKLREQRLRVTKKLAEWIGSDGVRVIEQIGKAAVGVSAIYGFLTVMGWV